MKENPNWPRFCQSRRGKAQSGPAALRCSTSFLLLPPPPTGCDPAKDRSMLAMTWTFDRLRMLCIACVTIYRLNFGVSGNSTSQGNSFLKGLYGLLCHCRPLNTCSRCFGPVRELQPSLANHTHTHTHTHRDRDRYIYIYIYIYEAIGHE